MAVIVDTFLVVLAITDTLARKLLAQLTLITLILLSPPGFDNSEHELSSLRGPIITYVSLSWVVENTIDDTGDSAINVNIFVIPCGNKLRNDP